VSPAQRKGKGRQGRPGRRRPAPPPPPRSRWRGARTVALIVLAAAVVLTTAGFAIFRGLGDPSIASGDIAVVQGAPNEDVSAAEYKRALLQAVPRLGLKQLPKAGTSQYTQVRDSAISDLLLGRWIEGEAADRGITVSSSQVSDQLQQIIKTQFGNSQKQFQQFLSQSHFTQQDALERVRLQVISQQVQQQVLPQNKTPTVSSDTAKNYYEANIVQFQQPQTRDVRLILNKSQAQVAKAASMLKADDSAANWKKVAKKYSTDPTTKTAGGLRQGVAQGQSEPALDKQVFSAPPNQIVGPFKGQSGYYAIEVTADHPASTQPFSKVQSQIQQQLGSLQQQQVAQNFQNNFVGKWTSQTFCASGYVIDRCENFTAPVSTTGGGAVVPSTKPVEPGHAAVFFSAPQGLPQGPIGPPSETPAVPGGSTIPLGPSGAPSVPPGSAPPGSVPPSSAPPSSAPPSSGP
jgi:parvulin-like peptidyl-prolyl isomerase